MSEKTLGGAWLQNESAANTIAQPSFPFNQVLETESGHTLEFDDTPGRERVRLGHRMGTFIEMNPDGSITIRSSNNTTIVVEGNNQILANGDYSLTVNGDAYISSKGNTYQSVTGDYNLTAEGHINIISKKTISILSDSDMKIGANPNIGGALRLVAGDHVYLNADLAINGEITALKMTSKGRIDAAMGISAGPMGFVSATGGLAVGIPSAIPGCVIAAMDISAGGQVSAPLGTFAEMTAGHASDGTNCPIYDAHIHVAPHGMTSPPTTQMLIVPGI